MTPASKRAAVMDTEGATSRKRARTSTTDAQSHAAAKALVASTLDDPANDTLPESDVVQLARYARYLEAQLSATCGTTSGKVQAKRGTAQAAKSAAHVAMSTAEAATGTAQAKTETVRISRRPLKQLVRAADSFKRSVADRISEQMNVCALSLLLYAPLSHVICAPCSGHRRARRTLPSGHTIVLALTMYSCTSST